MSKRRVTTALLWGGLMLTLIGMLTCGAGCMAGVDAVISPDGTVKDAERAGSAAGIGIWIVVIGVIAAIVGAAGKMIASARSSDDR